MDSVNFTTFIKKPPQVTDIQKNILFTKEILTGRLFMGCYKERRYVPVLNEYRDVIAISSEETELHQDIDKVRSKWLGVTDIKWVGITGPNAGRSTKGYCFWVKLLDKPFGYYWFQIKHVKLLEEELILHLKCIRKTYSLESAITSRNNGKIKVDERTTNITTNSLLELWYLRELFMLGWEKCENYVHVIRPYLTWQNLLSTIRMGCAFTIIFFIGMISTVHHLGEFLLKLIQELARLVNAFTPIFVHLIDFLSKIIGGFYILLAGIFIGNRRQASDPQPFCNNCHSIPYSSIRRVSLPNGSVNWRERNRILRLELLSDSKRS